MGDAVREGSIFALLTMRVYIFIPVPRGARVNGRGGMLRVREMLRERVGIFALSTVRVYIFIPVPRGRGKGKVRMLRVREMLCER